MNQPASDAAQTRDPSPPVPVAFCRIPVRRFWQLILLLSLPLYFQGCEGQRTRHTAGLIVPFVLFEEGDPFPGGLKLISFSPARCVVNFGLLTVGLIVALRRWPRFAAMVETRSFRRELLFIVLLFDSFLYWPFLWVYVVFFPLGWFNEAVRAALGFLPEKTANYWSLIVAARLLFLAELALLRFVLHKLIGPYWRRVVLARPDRWWQYRLSGLLTLMLIFGVGAGMLARWILASRQ